MTSTATVTTTDTAIEDAVRALYAAEAYSDHQYATMDALEELVGADQVDRIHDTGRADRYRFAVEALEEGRLADPTVATLKKYSVHRRTFAPPAPNYGYQIIQVCTEDGVLVSGAVDLGVGTDLRWNRHDGDVDSFLLEELFTKVLAAFTA